MAGRNIDQISTKTPLHVDTFFGGFYSIFYSIFQVDIPRTYQPYLPQHRSTSSIDPLHHGGGRQGRALPAGTLQRWAIAPSTATLSMICVASRSGSGRRRYAPETGDENQHRRISSMILFIMEPSCYSSTEYEYVMNNSYTSNITINKRYYYSLFDIAVSLSLLLPLASRRSADTLPYPSRARLGPRRAQQLPLGTPWRINHHR